MKVHLVIQVAQKMTKRWRRMDIPYITVDRLTFAEYHVVSNIILDGISAIAEQLHSAGFEMSFRGDKLEWSEEQAPKE